jgi:hypothetical protein
MKIKEKLQEIVQYFGVNRQVGHTTTMLHGTLDNTEPVVIIAHNQTGVNHIKNITKKTDKVVSLESLNSSLKGHRSPLVFDNAALHLLLLDSLGEISSLELNVREEKEKMEDLINEIIGFLEDQIKYHEDQIERNLEKSKHYAYLTIHEDFKEEYDENLKQSKEFDNVRLSNFIVSNYLKNIKNDISRIIQ